MSTENGRATLRDVLSLQNDMHAEIKCIREDVTRLRIQNARTTAIIAIIMSVLTSSLTFVIISKLGEVLK